MGGGRVRESTIRRETDSIDRLGVSVQTREIEQFKSPFLLHHLPHLVKQKIREDESLERSRADGYGCALL